MIPISHPDHSSPALGQLLADLLFDGRPTAAFNGNPDSTTAANLLATANAIVDVLTALTQVGSVSLDWRTPGAERLALEAYHRRRRGLIDLVEELRTEAEKVDPTD